MQQARGEVETRRKKIVMVHPQFPPSFWSFGFVKDIGGFKTVMPPLGLATVAALTPDRYDVSIVDENIEPIDFEVEADLIVLSAMGIQEERLFEVADRFRANGYTVCITNDQVAGRYGNAAAADAAVDRAAKSLVRSSRNHGPGKTGKIEFDDLKRVTHGAVDHQPGNAVL